MPRGVCGSATIRQFDIDGLNRAGCAAAIERAAAAVAGVETAVCEPARGRLRVEGRFDAAAVQRAIAALGYRAEPRGLSGAAGGNLARLLWAALFALGQWLAFELGLMPAAGSLPLGLWLVVALLALLWLVAPMLRRASGDHDPAAVVSAGAALLAWLTLLLADRGGLLDPRPWLYLPFAIVLLGALGIRLSRRLQLTAGELAWRRCAARRLVLVAILLAALGLALELGGPLSWAQTAVVVLTLCAAVSPFVLTLAGPWVYREAAREAEEDGVLLGNAGVLSRLDRLDTVLLCRTGVVTGGDPEVVGIEPLGQVAVSDLLRYVAALEANLEQPLARALVRAARGRDAGAAEAAELTPGRGICGRVGGERVVIGQRDFLREQGIDTAPLEARAAEMAADGGNAVWLAVEGEPCGLFEVADPLRPDTAEAVRRLRRLGLGVVLVSAAPAPMLEAIGRSIEVDRAVSGAPATAAADLLKIDGLSAALVWAQAPPGLDPRLLSVAVDPGARHVPADADLTLRRPSLHALVEAVELGRRAQRLVRSGRLFGIVYHLLALSWAAGLLAPLVGPGPRPGLAFVASVAALGLVLVNARRSHDQPALVEGR